MQASLRILLSKVAAKAQWWVRIRRFPKDLPLLVTAKIAWTFKQNKDAQPAIHGIKERLGRNKQLGNSCAPN